MERKQKQLDSEKEKFMLEFLKSEKGKLELERMIKNPKANIFKRISKIQSKAKKNELIEVDELIENHSKLILEEMNPLFTVKILKTKEENSMDAMTKTFNI